MTRMMQIFEEYLAYKSYKYIRLDGSTTIESRREMVQAWQTNPKYLYLCYQQELVV